MSASVEAAEAPQKENRNHDEGQLPEAFARPSAEELEVARELVRSARERGTALTGPGGLLKALTKTGGSRPRWMRKWPTTSAMTSTTRPARTPGTPAGS